MTEIIDLTPPYASFSRRFAAVVIDAMILFIPAFVLGSIVPVAGGLVAWFLYAPFLESSVLKATVGKKVMGIQVVDLHGKRISFRAAMLRAVMKIISSALCFLPHLTALFTEKKQAVHDLVAETVVVHGRVDFPALDAWLNSFHEVFRGSEPELFDRPTSRPAEKPDRIGALERLQALFEKGALSKDEFEKEKAKLLNS